MNNILKKNLRRSYINLNPWVFAITVSIIIYGLLLLFSPVKVTTVNHTKYKHHIIMLPLNSSRNYPEQKQLRYWLRENNPTMIVRPSDKYGYSSILNPHFSLSLDKTSTDIDSMFFPPFFFNKSFKIAPIPLVILSPAQLFSRLTLASEFPTVPPITTDQKTKLKYPYVKDYYTGKQLHVKFSSKIEKLIKKNNPLKPTILSVDIPSNSTFFPIPNVESSCGSPELDNEALKSLTTNQLSNDKSLQGKRIKVYVEWK